MAKKQLRSRVVAATGGLAAAALLAGPALTWGLDVAGTSVSAPTAPVTTAVQTVTNTVQQTTSTAVSTVQAAAPAPVQQAAQPVVQQVQATTAPAAAAPKAPAPTQSAPARVVQHVAAPAMTSVTRAATTATTTAATHVATTAVRTAAATAKTATTATRAATHRARKSEAPLSARSSLLPCDQIVAMVPALGGLNELVAVICNAGNAGLPARMGPATDQSPLAKTLEVLGATVTGAGGHSHRRVAGAGTAAPRRVDAHRVDARSAGQGVGAGSALPTTSSATPGPISVASPSAAAAARTPGASSSGTGGVLSHLHIPGVEGTGAQALALLLIIDAELLLAMLAYGAIRRWVFPRSRRRLRPAREPRTFLRMPALPRLRAHRSSEPPLRPGTRTA